MSLPTLPKVQKLQAALHAKAKGSPEFRFYALYDKVYRDDVPWVAYRRCLINGGADEEHGYDERIAFNCKSSGAGFNADACQRKKSNC